MQPTADDKLAASVFAVGLGHNFVRREEVVQWADRRIIEIDCPPTWLMDVSLSEGKHLWDLIGELKRIAEGVDPVASLRAVYAILPNVSSLDFDQAATFAKRVYRITREHLDGDWSHQLLGTTDSLADDFELLRTGHLEATKEDLIGAVQTFIDGHRNARVLELVRPVRWWTVEDERPKSNEYNLGSLVNVGLSAWIIQDGNYGDFEIGQEANFALEFYPVNLHPAQVHYTAAEHLGASRYRIQGQVIFANNEVWVIDAGAFVAFEERKPPPCAVVGAWVEGEIYVGIDPFFYLERLHKLEGMPPLTYTWKIEGISLETTPWIVEINPQGGSFRIRDESREAFVPRHETNAWNDDGGNANYTLGCQRISDAHNP